MEKQKHTLMLIMSPSQGQNVSPKEKERLKSRRVKLYLNVITRQQKEMGGHFLNGSNNAI